MADGKCAWDGCPNPRHTEMPICFVHAYQVHRQIDDLLTDEVSEPERTHVVYYLAISPTTVKIGTTGDIKGRMRGLRTDLQYVLAVEPGDYTVEHQRHKEFSQDRIGRREDFRVSPELEHHIKQLQASDYSTEFLAAQM